ncbi:uncharacterized protein [Porites lutea]|uniref:uncharacterized protein n=1 Tax=Porites lutea TaxID=51062 RepID=UPI003CC6491A
MNRQSNSTIQQENKNEYNELSNWATRQPQIYARKYNVPLRREHNGIGHNTVLPLNPPVEENMKRSENSRELDPDYKDFEQQFTKGKTGLQNGCIRLDQPVYNILEELPTQGEPNMNMNRPENSRELDPDYEDFEQQSTEGKTGLQNGCTRLDQPVYNILEELPTQGEPNMNMNRPENSRELDPDYEDFEQQSTEGKTGLQNGCIRLDQPVYNILEELPTQGEPMTLNNCDNKALKQVLQKLHPKNATENSNGGCSTSKGHLSVKDPKEPMSDGTEREYKVLEGPIAEGDTFHHGANPSKGPLYYTQEEPRQNDPHGEQEKNYQHQGDRVYHVLEENTYLNTFQFPNGTF